MSSDASNDGRIAVPSSFTKVVCEGLGHDDVFFLQPDVSAGGAFSCRREPLQHYNLISQWCFVSLVPRSRRFLLWPVCLLRPVSGMVYSGFVDVSGELKLAPRIVDAAD